MRLFVVYGGEKYIYMVATKGNKRKSRNFYYRHVGFSGVEFVKRPKIAAHTCVSENDAKLLVTYLQRRIKEEGFLLRKRIP